MKVLPLASLLALLSVTSASTPAFSDDSSNDRIAADQSAKTIFHELNFFSEGGGMHLSPGLASFADPTDDPLVRIFGLDADLMRHKWGFNWNEDTNEPHGFFNVPYKGMNVGVVGCVTCHSGRAAGQYIIGLGNKNIDVHQLGQDLTFIETVWKETHNQNDKNADYQYVEDGAISFASLLANEKITNLTQGLVPTAAIRSWFFNEASVPIPDDFPRAAVKVPFLWGYGEKKKVGQFCDGFGNGNYPGWGIAVELTAGQKVDVVRDYLPKIANAEVILGDLLPPPYPFSVDMTSATRGKALFEQTCAHCHGTYSVDPAGLPVYEAPKFIDWAVVQTDHDRLEGDTPQFLELVQNNPLNDVIKYNAIGGTGYFAPRLVGVWSRFPYLHNASVPSVRALLTPPDQRPHFFSLKDSGELDRFDSANLGLTVPDPGSLEADALAVDAGLGARDVYSTERNGQSNQGHNFYTDLADEQKLDLIEYLKTL